MSSRWILAFLMAGAFGANASEAPAVVLTRHPWVSLLTPTSALIAWQTDAPTEGKVFHAVAPPAWTEASVSGAALDHAIPLTGLEPGTVYHYRVVSDADTLADTLSFRTAPVAGEPYRFIAMGDLGTATAAQMQVAARVDSLNADFGILTGDIIYPNGEPWYFTPYFFDIYRPTIARIPFYPSLGNHDTYYDGGASYLNTFYLPSNNPAATERYYSFDYGNAHFVALDVTVENSAPDPAMIAWLDADLAATHRSWKFVFFHVPMYSNSGTHGGDTIIGAALEPIFEARGVDIVFQGHNHYYTRTYPISAGEVVNATQDPSYVNPDGPIYIVTGGGGRSLYEITTPLSPIEVVSKSTYHATVVDVDGSSLTLRAVETDGTVFDTMTLQQLTPTAVEVTGFTAQSDPEGIRLRWSVSGSIVGTVAFKVYRSASPEDAPRLLTGEPVLVGREYEFVDHTARPGATYAYRLGIVEDGRERITGWIQAVGGSPPRFRVGSARPNPSEGTLVIPYVTESAMAIRARIVDPAGRLVRTLRSAPSSAGAHALRWDGHDQRGRPAPSGIYFALIRAGSHEARVRLALVR